MIANILAAYGLKKSAGAYFFTRVTDAAGDHWITVHPNGPGTKGQPVLLSKGGEIKGGMGGKFNGMHISSAQGSQGDPLTRGNMELQRSKWQKKNYEKAPKGVLQTERSRRIDQELAAVHESTGEGIYVVSGHEANSSREFVFPKSELRVNSQGTITHMSPEALKFWQSYKQRYDEFNKTTPKPEWYKTEALKEYENKRYRLYNFSEWKKYEGQTKRAEHARTVKRIKQQYEQLNLF